MATGGQVLSYLCPEINWTIIGDDYDSIIWHDLDQAPITKKQFEDGFNKYDAWKTELEISKTSQRQAILDRIGLTADEAKLILG